MVSQQLTHFLGLPTIDIDDLKGNTEYHKYQPTSLQVIFYLSPVQKA